MGKFKNTNQFIFAAVQNVTKMSELALSPSASEEGAVQLQTGTTTPALPPVKGTLHTVALCNILQIYLGNARFKDESVTRLSKRTSISNRTSLVGTFLVESPKSSG